MTLACVVAALVFSGDLNRDEQWLLGGAAGGTLLGILVGRAAARRAWLWGPLIGVLATCGAASLLQLGLPEDFSKLSPSAQEYAAENYYPILLASVAIGLTIVAATTAVYLLLVALLSMNPRTWSRRQRRGAVLAAVIAGATFLVVWFGDRVHDPHAWRPKRVIVLPKRVKPLPDLGMHWIKHELVLSPTGKWIAIANYDVATSGMTGGFLTTWIYRADGCECPATLARTLRKASSVAFSPDERQVAFCEPSDWPDLHLVQLADGSETATWRRRYELGDETHWLGSGQIAMTWTREATANPGPPGYSVLEVIDPTTGSLLRARNGQQVITVSARFGYEYRRDWTQVLVCDAASGEEIKTVSSGHRDRPIGGMLGLLPDYPFEASLDLDYAFTTSESWEERYCLLDLKDGSRRPLQETPAAFTRSNQLLTYTGFPAAYWRTPDPWDWRCEVPLVMRCYRLLQTGRVRAIDPASGAELAHTAPTWGLIQRLALSHDGSTMAVLTERRVYVYDVPEGFR
jgi:hypothetical protein